MASPLDTEGGWGASHPQWPPVFKVTVKPTVGDVLAKGNCYRIDVAPLTVVCCLCHYGLWWTKWQNHQGYGLNPWAERVNLKPVDSLDTAVCEWVWVCVRSSSVWPMYTVYSHHRSWEFLCTQTSILLPSCLTHTHCYMERVSWACHELAWRLALPY